MPVKTSVELLEVIEKSKLLSADQLAAARQLGDQQSDPKEVVCSLIRDRVLTKWQALQLLAGRWALALGKYKLLDHLDTEGRERVVLAEDPDTGRNVAILLLARGLANQNPERFEQLREAGNRLASLDHPSILSILEISSEGDRCFVVTELPGGQSLGQTLREKGPFPAELVVNYLSQAAQALRAAHERGVSHGDLRLENLMVDDHGKIKVRNLGSAWIAQTGEQPLEADQAARDLVALGSVMFAALTGQVPDSQPTIESLRELRPDVPEALVRCFQKLTAAEPDARYAAIAELADDLRTVSIVKPPPVPSAKSKSIRESAQRKAPPEPVAKETVQPAVPAPTAPKTAAPKETGQKTAGQTNDAGPRIVIPGLPDASSTPAAAPGALAINTKTRRRSPKKSATAKSAGNVKADRTVAADASGRAGIPKNLLMIGGASLGGIAVLVVLVVVAMHVFSGSGQVQVADADVASGIDAGGDSGVAADFADGAESDPELQVGRGALAEETDPELPVAPGSDVPPTPEASPASPADPSVAADGEPGTELAEGVASVAEQGAGDRPSEPAVQPAMPEEEEPGAEPEEAAEPLPKEEPVAQQPDESAPESPAKPEMPAKAPFADMPPQVALPSPDANGGLEPQVLGPVHTVRTREGQCYIRMRGGETAQRGNRVFAMRSAEGGTADWDWDIQLRDGAGGAELKVAHLSLNDQLQLVFQWLPAAREDSAAAHLTNCALSMTCRGETHVLGLRQPAQAAVLEVNLKESAVRHTVKIDHPPDPDKIRIEITSVQGVKYKIEPNVPLMAERGEAWIKLEDGGGLLSLKVESDMRRDLQMVLTPFVQFNPDSRPERLMVRQFQQVKAQRMAAVNQWGTMLQKGQAFVKSKASEQEKKQAAQHLRNYENELRISRENLTKFEAFEQFLEKSKPQIGFRVFYDADGSQMDLLVAGN